MTTRLAALAALGLLAAALGFAAAAGLPASSVRSGERLAARAADEGDAGGDGATPVSPQAPTAPSGPHVLRARPSSFDGSLRTLPGDRPIRLVQRGEEDRLPTAPAEAREAALAAPQRRAAHGLAPAARTSDGLSLLSESTGPAPVQIGAGYPPDVNIDVGPEHIIETVNTGYAIYRKDTRALVAANTMDALFGAAPVPTGTACDVANQGDPVVVYDTIADRWVISDFAWTDEVNGPFYECFAVSKTGDPVNGGWWFYAYDMGQYPAGAPVSDSYFPDYPKLGIWPDGLYMTLNMFDPLGNWSNGRAVAFDRTALEAGTAADAVVFDLTMFDGGLLPANARVQTGLPPAGRPELLAEMGPDFNTIGVWKMHVDWADPPSSWISHSATPVATTPYTQAPDPVPSPGNDVDTLSDRLMMQLQYSAIGGSESLWVTHAARTPSDTAGVAWHELDVTGGVIARSAVQSSIWAPDATLNRFMPSIAVDRVGDAALGYATSSAATNPDIRATGRLAGDAASTLSFDERILQAGGGAQTHASIVTGDPITRWGDYTSMTLDPVDGCTFWYAGEYYAAPVPGEPVPGGNWRTAISSFSFSACRSRPTAVRTPKLAPARGIALGSVLTAGSGAWSNVPTSYSYLWQRNAGRGWVRIPDATGATYRVTAADLGRALRARVTAANRFGRGSVATARVVVPMRLVARAGLPAAGAVGSLIRIRLARWSAGIAARRITWRRDGVPIPGATDRAYRIRAADRGHAITVTETVNGLFASTSRPMRVT